MSIPEIVYRQKKAVESLMEYLRYTGYFPPPPDCSLSNKLLPAMNASYPLRTEEILIFDQNLDYSNKIDWHLDLKTGNRFPLIHSSKIDIRTSKYGSAKHVWEVNRLQFLPQICLNFKKTGENRFLEKFMMHIESWILGNPYLIGVNWYSNIEINIRLINWFICWEILDAKELAKSNDSFKEFVYNKWIPLVYLHCLHSRRHLSKYSSANNHLISEFAGLYIANSVWKFKESDKWLRLAKKGLEREIIRQHTRNGINKEEAAEYIQFITDFFLICYIVGKNKGDPFSSGYIQMLKKIFDYIYEFTDCKGNFPKYGDEDDGQVFRLSKQLENNFLSLLTTGSFLFNLPRYTSKIKAIDLKTQLLLGHEVTKDFHPYKGLSLQQSHFFAEDGHFIFRNHFQSKEIYLHFNAAPLGYLSIAAHGHADALSFIIHTDGKPFFVDPGTYSYHTDPEWRKYFISTLAHNTVCVQRKNQAAYGGSTLWLTQYKTQIIKALQDELVEMAFASHDGYKKMGIQHNRRIELYPKTNEIIITDFLKSSNASEFMAEIPFHLSPDVLITNESNNSFLLKQNESKLQIICDPQVITQVFRGSKDPLLGWYSESFQKINPTSVICCSKLVKCSAELTFKISIIEI
jgi:hypothetical protein